MQIPMSMLSPDWSQPMPTPEEAHAMCRLVPLAQVPVSEANLVSAIQELCRSHTHGGALLAAFEVGPNSDFDWFASRNRLLEFDILPLVLARREVRDALPELMIPDFCIDWSRASMESANGFEESNSFNFDGKLSQMLFNGGAYGSSTHGDGRAEKEAALRFCDTAFGMRFSEVSYFRSHSAWTHWFGNISTYLDWTAVLVDRRLRRLWILAVTDSD
jgi:hypothetical protein